MGPGLFAIENWPVRSEAAKAELADMVATGQWDVQPLPTYDIKGAPVVPELYQRRLEGAPVEVRFSLSHWSIPGKDSENGTDVYTADIERLRVLQVPVPRTPTLRRWNIYTIDPTAGSGGPPCKRSRCSA